MHSSSGQNSATHLLIALTSGRIQRQRQQAQLQHRSQQIEGLYGPLLSLIEAISEGMMADGMMAAE